MKPQHAFGAAPRPPVWISGACLGIILAAMGWAGSATGAPVTSETAAGAIQGWLRTERTPLGEPLSGSVRQVRTVNGQDGRALYHVVSLEPTGFVIVSGEDGVEPIICFAASGEFDGSTNNPLGALVSRDLPNRVGAARKARPALDKPALQARARWQQLTRAQASGVVSVQPDGIIGVSDVRVPPLLQSAWDQQTAAGAGSTACYNYYTPPHGAGNLSNYPAGCVATCMAQLMRYYQRPTTGVGTGSFSIKVDGVTQSYALRGGDGAGGVYAWTNMPLVPSSTPAAAQCQAIGALVADAGATVNMSYAASGSSSILLNASGVLVSTFHYANSIGGYNNNSDLGTNLIAIINPGLDARCPVLLGIQGSSGGHAVVADGYGYNGATLYHHLNLGWSGASTAWYALPLIDTSAYTFTLIDQCAYNVYTNGSGEIISGRVLDQIARPVANATVTATRSGGGTYTTTTDVRGIYALAQLPSSSSYTMVVAKTNFASATNTFATGRSLNNQAKAGNFWGANFTLNMLATAVDHFAWSAIGGGQLVNTPFALTLTAQNATNGVATGYTNTAALVGSVTGLTATNTMIGNLSWGSAFTSSSDTTIGYAFTPATNLQVVAVRSYNGDKISIWTDSGTLLATQAVTSVAGTWVETALASNLTLTAGMTYRVTAHIPPTTYNYFLAGGWPATFANGAIGQNLYYAYGDVFPVNVYGTGEGPLVDLRYALVYSNTVPISPTTSGAFVSGVWSGTVSVLQTVTNLVLRADDGAGHVGLSGSLTVTNIAATLPNITGQPQSLTNNTGDTASFSLMATGSPAPAYFWRRNGTVISGANATAYSLANVQLPDSGSQFSCIVSNAAGSRTSQVATLTVTCTNVTVAAQPHVTLSAGGTVYAVAPVADGTWIIGGYFSSINGSTRYCLARLLADGSLDPNWNPSANSTVLALAVSGTNVYAGGYFTSVGGQPRSRLARLSLSGTGAADATWNPNAISLGATPYVDALAVNGANVYAGGYFTNIGGLARNSIASLGTTGSGTADAIWNPNCLLSGSAGNVDAILVDNTNVYVGGLFDTLGGLGRNCLARLSLGGAGAADANWNPNVLGEVLALDVSGSNIYAGGAFTTVNGVVARNYIARFSSAGAVDAAWNPGADSEVSAVAAWGTRVYVGGSFTNIGGLPRTNLAKLNAAGTGAADPIWEADPNGVVWALALGNTNLAVAGAFTQIGGQARPGVASLAFPPFKLGAVGRSGNGQFSLSAGSEPGLGFEILASTNLSNWISLGAMTNYTGWTNYTDRATNLPRRFYRARQLP